MKKQHLRKLERDTESRTEIEEERQKGHKGREERQTLLWHLSHSGSALLWVEKGTRRGHRDTTEEGKREVKQLMSD